MSYQRLTLNEIKRIEAGVRKGYSLRVISGLIRKSKSTVYYHFRRIKGKCIKPVKVQDTNPELIGEFIGLFAGDGCVYKTYNYAYRTYIYLNKNEETYAKELVDKVLIKIFGRKPTVFYQKNRIDLCYYSKSIHDLIRNYLVWGHNDRKTYSVRLRSRKLGRRFVVGFLRGCLDSDGYLSEKKISYATVSPGLMRDISAYLNILKIEHSVDLYIEKRLNRRDIYHIDIRKKEFERFMIIIKPRNIKEPMRRPGFEVPNAGSYSISRVGGLEGRSHSH
jgi:hypothetical protein